ncbi:MAG: hypothetical protein FWG73_01860 [Planctomycetaceae bacterium]|nr:hypothetical protein [Planctomycetaceae bacterium]
MKTKLLLAALSCLVFCSVVADVLPQDDYFEQRKSPMNQELQKQFGKALTRAAWNGTSGNGIILGLLSEPGFRAELNMSDAQYEQLQETANDMRNPQKNPELRQIYDEIKAIEIAHASAWQNADEETKKRFFDLQNKVFALTTTSGNGLNPHSIANALEMTLTPQQKQKLKEVQLAAALSDVSIFPPSMFEALGLTDAQKQEMETIKKELEGEYEEILEDIVNRRQMIDDKIHAEMEKQGYRGVNFELLDAVIYKEVTEDLVKVGNEIETHGKQFSSQFQAKMFDVLTDERWLRLQDLIDHPTGLVKVMQDKLKEWANKQGEWQPGAGSWRPGDAIPDRYRQERNTRGRFPRPAE